MNVVVPNVGPAVYAMLSAASAQNGAFHLSWTGVIISSLLMAFVFFVLWFIFWRDIDL